MAQQLQAANEEVALLALIDVYSGVGAGPRYGPLPQLLGRHRRVLAGLPLKDRPAYVLQRARNIAAYAGKSLSRRMLLAAGWVHGLRNGARPGDPRGSLDVHRAISTAYRAKPYCGDAVLFKAELGAWTHTDAHDGWQKLIQGRLQVISVTGGHSGLLHEPHVRRLAGKLAAYLEE